MKKLLVLLFLSASMLFGVGFYDKGETKGITVEVESSKTLIEGDNDITIKLSKNGKTITDAKVRAKFFMPEMPGMPYMEYIGMGKLNGDKYDAMVNFSMGGTWQYHIQFKHQGKKYAYRGSVNLGQDHRGMKCAEGKCGGGCSHENLGFPFYNLIFMGCRY